MSLPGLAQSLLAALRGAGHGAISCSPRALYGEFQRAKRYRRWIRAGRPVPPPAIVKQRTVIEHARRFRCPVFVETGTHLGDMVSAVHRGFERIYTIELSPDLHRRALERLGRLEHVSLLLGDSGEVLRRVLERIDRPCLFWLDAHYSGGETARGALETPVLGELTAILEHPLASSHVILVDDARCFTESVEYPRLERIEEACIHAGLAHFEVRDDIVRIHRGEPRSS